MRANAAGLIGLILLYSGFDTILQQGPEAIALLEVLAGAFMAGSVLIGLRRSKHKRHGRVDRVEVAAAAVFIMEGVHELQAGTHDWRIASAYFLAAILAVLLGIFHARIAHLRRLVLTQKGIFARTSPFRKFRVAWKNVKSLEVGESAIHMMTDHNKRHTVKLAGLKNGREVITAILAHPTARALQK